LQKPQNKQSTWRQRELVLQAGIVHTVDFFADTSPNHIMINNLSSSKLYLSPNGIPSPQIYDKEIAPFGESLYAQDTGLKRFQLYIEGTGESRMKITTFEADFTPSTLSGGNVSVTGGSGGSGGNVTVVGHSVPLPAGSNNIGKVVVTSMPEQTIQLDTLPAGSNTIGKVDVNTLPPLATGDSHIGSVGVDGSVAIGSMPNVVISSMPPVQVTNDPIKQSHEHFYGSVGTTEVIYDLGVRSLTKFNHIVNDDLANDLFISFDEVAAITTPGSGANGIIVLKPGEVINDLGRKCSKVRFIRSAGAGNVRMLGV
jgi:hypothetical protein